MAPLEGIRIKIQRANEQIKDLDSFVEAFKVETYVITHQDYPSRNLRGYRLNVDAGEDRGLKLISIRAGEIIHHLRSCFDHLIEQLILKANNTPARTNQFPVVLIPGNYKAEASRRIHGVIKGSDTLIEKLQPYNGLGEDDPLHILHKLDIVDKHRLLLTGNTVLTHLRRWPGGNIIRGTMLSIDRIGSHAIPTFSSLADIKMGVNPQFFIMINLDEIPTWRERPIVELLANLSDFTLRSIGLFDKFF